MHMQRVAHHVLAPAIDVIVQGPGRYRTSGVGDQVFQYLELPSLQRNAPLTDDSATRRQIDGHRIGRQHLGSGQRVIAFDAHVGEISVLANLQRDFAPQAVDAADFGFPQAVVEFDVAHNSFGANRGL